MGIFSRLSRIPPVPSFDKTLPAAATKIRYSPFNDNSASSRKESPSPAPSPSMGKGSKAPSLSLERGLGERTDYDWADWPIPIAEPDASAFSEISHSPSQNRATDLYSTLIIIVRRPVRGRANRKPVSRGMWDWATLIIIPSGPKCPNSNSFPNINPKAINPRP
jgi:hypothetical protein